jgi:alpha-D-ribose 1-methylphosphonate 5-phosphate C-P lyase
MSDYNFAYLDEQTKRMIRRAILKGVAVPGYQVPFASREMPMPYGWGTGGVQVSAACLTPEDTLKVIDQGADDTTNAVSIRKFFEKTAGVAVTEGPRRRHHPDPPPHPRDAADRGQILVYQVPIPEPLRFLEPRETETRKMHALEEYGLMHVKLYEDIARHGEIATGLCLSGEGRGALRDGPLADPEIRQPQAGMAAIQLFGAGREQRIYAVPPYTRS